MENIISQIFGTAEERSQIRISKLESNVILVYGDLLNEFPKRKNQEEKLTHLQAKTSEVFNKNEVLLSALGNTKEENRMKTSRFAYRAIPFIDAALVLYPLLSIVEKEWTEIPGIAIPLAILLGIFFSLIGRWTANELSNKTGKKWFAYICVLIVPSIYWINYLGFNNGTLIFTVMFSLISGGVQFFIIYFFPGLQHAISYADSKATYENSVEKEEKQIQKLLEHAQNFSRKFYTELGLEYHKLLTSIQIHLDKFGKSPNIALKQTLLCVCNLAFYNYEAIPYRRRNGQIEGVAIIVDTPELSDLYMTDEVRFFAYMLKQAGRESRLTELMNRMNSTPEIKENTEMENLPQGPIQNQVKLTDEPDSEFLGNLNENESALPENKIKEEDDAKDQEFTIW